MKAKTKETKKRRFKKRYILLAIVAIIIFASLGSGGDSNDKKEAKTTTEASSKKKEKPKAKDKYVKVKKTFGAGYYTVGFKLLPGKYNVKAVSGNGNFVCNRAGINTILGTGNDDMYQKTYKNATFSDGDEIVIRGTLKVELTSVGKVKDVGLTGYDGILGKEKTLSNGNYVVGEDLKKGVYDITLVSGSGNVITDDGIVNEIFGSDSSIAIKKFSNAPIGDGTTIKVMDCTVKITPSK